MSTLPDGMYLPYAELLTQLQPIDQEERGLVEQFAARYSASALSAADVEDELIDSEVLWVTRNSFHRALLFLRDVRYFRALKSAFKP